MFLCSIYLSISIYLFYISYFFKNHNENSLLPLQKKSDIHLFHKTFILNSHSINELKCKTYPRYKIIIERFQKRLNAMQMSYITNESLILK